MKSAFTYLKKHWIKTAVTLCWLVLAAMLIDRDIFISKIDLHTNQVLTDDARVEYQGIYFKDKKIGYAKNHFLPGSNNTFTIEQYASMHLRILNDVHPITLDLKAEVSGEGTLQEFNFSFRSPFYQMTARGKVTGNQVTYTLSTGKTVITDTVTLEAPPILATSRRAYLLEQNPAPGDKMKIPWFDPVTLTGKETVIKYKGKEKILIQGRIHNLHHFVEFVAGARVNIWLNDKGDVIKEESPAGFIFLKEPKFKALAAIDADQDLLAAVAVPVTGSMLPLAGLTSIQYKLTLPEDTVFDLSQGRQTWNEPVLTLNLETLPTSASAATQTCRDSAAALVTTPYIQANHPDIKALVKELTASEQDHLQKINLLRTWVYNNIEKRPVLGIPDAVTTLHSKKGDCNEHAVLLAALARTADIPTRIIAGVVLLNDAFYYHAWNEVCLNEKWISLDSSNNQMPADLSHIKFIQGEIEEQLKIGALLGRLEIEPIHDQDNKREKQND